ncbi:MAG: SRPBCC family protein [Myxococcales bacterium]|nr:SRPBCC family protein [Myxococcales bacterium]
MRLPQTVNNIEESIVVEVPVRVAYNQWTQFEQFPRFMQGVRDVQQLDDRHLHWKAEIAGQSREWDAEITEQVPDQRIAWRNTDGPMKGGVVTFHRLSDDSCKVMLQMDYQPDDAVERLGDTLGIVRRRVRGDLERFQDFIEQRGEATGAYREEIS